MSAKTVAPLDAALVQRLVELSLREDRADLDLTTDAISQWLGAGRAAIVARADGVVCGVDFAIAAFRTLDPHSELELRKSDGDQVAAGDVIGVVRGNLRDLLRAERVALNWLQRLSGTATLTAAAVAAAQAGGHARILDTRKTTPGLRAAERYAVRCGGGLNHRDGLSAGILLKDNHLAAAAAAGHSLADTVRAALHNSGPATAVEVEVTTLAQAQQALDAGARALLLDNFAIEDLPPAVALAHEHGAVTEASGGITVAQITKIATAQVDYISLGALTHSAPALDIALDLQAADSPSVTEE